MILLIVFSYSFYSAVVVANFSNPAMYLVLFQPFFAAGTIFGFRPLGHMSTKHDFLKLAVDSLISSHAASYYGLRRHAVAKLTDQQSQHVN